MIPIVIDASITIAWLFEDEADDAAIAVAEAVAEHGALAPSLWHYEVGNVLLAAERRGRCSSDFVMRSLDRLGMLAVAIDQDGGSHRWADTLALARVEGLTVYDAAYLELAIRENASLATRDRELIAAARRRAVQVCGS
jgi:predicted nucleic acid-binding protein